MSTNFSLILFVFIFAVLGSIWFAWQYKKEKRSLWLGISFLAAFGMLLLLIGLILTVFWDIWAARILLIIGAAAAIGLLSVFPLTLIITLLVSGIQLIRREGISLSHMLSIFFGAAYILYLIIWPIFQGIPKAGFFDFLYAYLSFCFLFTISLFVLYTITNTLNLLKVPRKKYQYIIVLGSGLVKGNKIPPLLANRVDKGIDAFRENENSILIFSGGRGEDETVAEGEAMKDYALQKGVPESAVLVENKSVNTRENLLFSLQLIENLGCGIKENLLVVTTRYHVLRALLLAKNLGISCDGRGSKTKLYFSINAFIREWIAYLVLWRKKYISILIGAFIIIGIGFLL